MSITLRTIEMDDSNVGTIAIYCLEIDCSFNLRSLLLDIFLNRWCDSRLSLTATRRQNEVKIHPLTTVSLQIQIFANNPKTFLKAIKIDLE